MSKAPNVFVFEFGDRKNYYLQWRCPMSGKKKTKATDIPRTGKARDRKAAESLALELAQQLAQGSVVTPSRLTWAAFRERYESEVLPGLAKGTAPKVGTICNYVESTFGESLRLVELDAGRISHLAATIRKKGASESTINGYLGQLRAMMNWARRCGWIHSCPSFPKIQRKKKSKGTSPMKGRPLTAEELERMLACTRLVVGAKDAPAWVFYLRGLWASGLRLRESLEMYWDREDRLIPVFSREHHPMIQIPGELEKGHTDRLLPMSPEFFTLLGEVPDNERTGPVFPLPGARDGDAVGRTVSRIGKRAGVVVRVDPSNQERKKFASAHDLRRSFGDRWASRIMPADLQKLMRHESIETTLRYYVGANANRTAEAVWAAAEKAGPDAMKVPTTPVSQTVSPTSRKTTKA